MRGITSVLTGAAILIGAAGTIAAQQPPPREIFRRASIDSVMMKRAALGLQLSPTGTLRDTIGVFVARVSPKGPAENAGIVEGDRIVSINGVDLRVNAADAEDSYASAIPARRLTREVAKLLPGNPVTLRVSSGGRIRDVRVTAGRASDLRDGNSFGFMMNGGGPEELMLRSMPRMNIEDLPRMREQMRDLPLRIRLNESGVFRMLAPSRDRITDKK